MIFGYEYLSSGVLNLSRLVALYRHSGEVPGISSDVSSLNWFKVSTQVDIKDLFDIPTLAESSVEASEKNNSANIDEDKIFEKVEIEASFPGGEAKWRQYLERNLSSFNPADEGAPAGTYTTYVQFVVDKEGNISDVRSLTNHGYGMEETAIRIIKKGPKWNPAIQNEKQVKAYRKQPITFRVEEQ
jgi:protein TonB